MSCWLVSFSVLCTVHGMLRVCSTVAQSPVLCSRAYPAGQRRSRDLPARTAVSVRKRTHTILCLGSHDLAGQLRANIDHTLCIACPEGQVADSSNQCVNCTAGTYSDSAGSCSPCAAGKFAERDGMRACNEVWLLEAAL